MAEASCSRAIAFVLSQEGGYTNDPKDPGGPTNWGITIIDCRKYWKPDATAEDVKVLPLSVAKDIYHGKYWLKVCGPDLPSGLDLCTFDSGVNSGVARSNLWLGKAIGSPAKDYPTLAKQATAYPDQPKAIDKYCDTRLAFLQSLRTWSHFKGGWGKRVASLRATAHTMALQASGKPAGEVKAILATKVAQTKQNQSTALPKAITGLSANTVGFTQYWSWDILHVLVASIAILITVYLIRQVVQNIHQAKAYEDLITSM